MPELKIVVRLSCMDPQHSHHLLKLQTQVSSQNSLEIEIWHVLFLFFGAGALFEHSAVGTKFQSAEL